MHACIHTYIHTYIRTYMHSFIHTYIRTCIHSYIHTYVRTCIHSYIHTYIQHTWRVPAQEASFLARTKLKLGTAYSPLSLLKDPATCLRLRSFLVCLGPENNTYLITALLPIPLTEKGTCLLSLWLHLFRVTLLLLGHLRHYVRGFNTNPK